ncbi:MAG: DUF3108 domain-containing protein [Azoarcus sp.]|jgi:hypothetical protein|nr:DUF3108 domain-containing protein [Azoarcus sp.]
MKPTAIHTVFTICLALALVLGTAPGWAQEGGWGVEKWPEKGSVDFQVSLGFGGVPIGRASHTWSHDREQYRMRLAVETTGMAASLRKLGYVQQSEGRIDKGGLRPQRFDVTQLGKTPEAAVFDWDVARVSIQRGGRERRNTSLAAGDQDMLSVWRQVGGATGLPESLLVVGNKDFRRARITRLEDGESQTPAGRFATRHFKIRSEDGRITIDLWLALDRHMVPVRAVLDDTKSVKLVLEAASISPDH